MAQQASEPRKRRRRGSDSQLPAPKWLIVAGTLVGLGGTASGYHQANVAEHTASLSQAEAARLTEFRNRYEDLLERCTDQRLQRLEDPR